MFMFRFLLETDGLIIPDSVQRATWRETIERLTSLDTEALLRKFIEQLLWMGVKVLVAIAIYMAGRWIIGRIIRMMDASFERRRADLTLRSFLRGLIKGVCYMLLILAVVQLLGFNASMFVALLAASGFGIGMALSGTLQNFAGGVMIMMMKPYKVGDYIEAQGKSGTVREIKLFSTVITTTDNKRIYIPNSSISSAIVNNYSSEPLRRVDWKVSLAYGDDPAAARQAILEMVRSDPRTLYAPAEPFVALSELGSSSIDLVVRVWTTNAEYWELYFDMNERFYNELPRKGFHFPFPQMDVHLDRRP